MPHIKVRHLLRIIDLLKLLMGITDQDDKVVKLALRARGRGRASHQQLGIYYSHADILKRDATRLVREVINSVSAKRATWKLNLPSRSP
ncbi:hypothetical protein MA20_21210 [Bradyrhizobium japonicum]|uniref:Uncharacterized protein n=1 Tax=Bradyrhizobium japonicum TaxID=375 RepID=A0A0A3YU09_BRAJP|nr:hypothetical protein MA20_21210 [Bradyrhizobium japonicum]